MRLWRRGALRRHSRRKACFFEASGGYDRLLREALKAAKIRFSRVNPRQATSHAPWGVIGKTDRVDARMLSELGGRLRPVQTEPLAAARRALRAQAMRRRQLVEMRKQEAMPLQHAAARADIPSLITVFDRRISNVEVLMAAIIAADPELAETARRLQTVPGVITATARKLLGVLNAMLEAGADYRYPAPA